MESWASHHTCCSNSVVADAKKLFLLTKKWYCKPRLVRGYLKMNKSGKQEIGKFLAKRAISVDVWHACRAQQQ
jgi:hypothetical protein